MSFTVIGSHGPYQVGLRVGDSHLVSRELAEKVSLAVGGNGEVSQIDSGPTWNLWMINLIGPTNGSVTIQYAASAVLGAC